MEHINFDPNKDDTEQFVSKVEDLAKKLGYNEDAQVMAVKSVLPRDVYGICMTYKKLKDLKTFLIELFSNPKMREAVPGSASVASDVITTYLGSYMAKDEPRSFLVDNHIPFDGRGMSKAYLSNGIPMKLFFDSGASRSYLSKKFITLILYCMTCQNL